MWNRGHLNQQCQVVSPNNREELSEDKVTGVTDHENRPTALPIGPALSSPNGARILSEGRSPGTAAPFLWKPCRGAMFRPTGRHWLPSSRTLGAPVCTLSNLGCGRQVPVVRPTDVRATNTPALSPSLKKTNL